MQKRTFLAKALAKQLTEKQANAQQLTFKEKRTRNR
jgi:hypothetical protein